MKVKEMIEKLKEFDGELELKTKARYSEDIVNVSLCKMQYETLDKKYVYIG